MRSAVLLARHGETEWNVEGRRQGRLDSPLTDQGRRDAAQIAALVADTGVCRIAASPLGRAQKTASIIGESLGLPVTTVAELAEIDMGAFSGLTDAEIDKREPGWRAARSRDKYAWRFPGGESYADAAGRVDAGLTSVLDGDGLALIVSHAMVSRLLVRQLFGLDSAAALGFTLGHGQVLACRLGTAPPTPEWLGAPDPDPW